MTSHARLHSCFPREYRRLLAPVFNILEEVVEVMRGNARHVKAMRDCEWLAGMLRHGLLKESFIPPRTIRELRELTRYRESLIRIKWRWPIGSTRYSRPGTSNSGRLPLMCKVRALVAGITNIEQLADLASGAMRRKSPTL